jgi:hypothetical protein
MTHLQTTTFAVPLAEYAQQPTDFLIQNFADYPPEGKPTIAYQVNAGTHQEPGQKHIAVQVRRVGYPTLNIKMQGRRGEVSSPDRDLEGVQAVQGRNGLTLRYPDGLIARVPEEREVINRLGKATRRAVAIHHRFSRKARVLVPNWAMGYPIQITNQA